MSDVEEVVDAAAERPRDGDRVIRIRRFVLEDAIGLILAKAEDRKLSNETLDRIRRAIQDST